MEIQQFENLDLDAQACLTWREGVHLAYRSKGEFYMSLYRLSNFYVELTYHTCCDGVIEANCFECEDQLQFYLEQINISCLFRMNDSI